MSFHSWAKTFLFLFPISLSPAANQWYDVSRRNYENSRVEYDAYRNEITTLQNAQQTESNKNKLLELQVPLFSAFSRQLNYH